ncbi:type I-E CRISPR-associated protein Cas7/Cse4/CasC [Leptospira sp. WS92.C1]
MKHLELHIIQSVPVACLNRDDLNSPKTAVFGGVQRARVSSQSWKRAIRELAKSIAPDIFGGNRTRLFVQELSKRLEDKKVAKEVAIFISEEVANLIETLDTKSDSEGYKKIKTLMFFSSLEYDKIIENILKIENIAKEFQRALALNKEISDLKKNQKGTGEKELKEKENEYANIIKKTLKLKNISAAIKSVELKDAADIALFGRMVANDHSLMVEAASMCSHALSVHKSDNEIDFFSALDDLQPKEEMGAGHTSTLEFNSATFYRFVALNLDMLADKEHLGALSSDERKSVVKTFVDSTIKAIPNARKNTMNANTFPSYVLAIVRNSGHPVQLINAFEKPVVTQDGFISKSIDALLNEYFALKETWGLESSLELAIRYQKNEEKKKEATTQIPEKNLSELLSEVIKHVV